jgi:hypothetical protein
MTSKSTERERRVSRRTIIRGICEFLEETNNMKFLPAMVGCIQGIIEEDMGRTETRLFVTGIEPLETVLCELESMVELQEGEHVDGCIDALDLVLEKVDEWARYRSKQEEIKKRRRSPLRTRFKSIFWKQTRTF